MVWLAEMPDVILGPYEYVDFFLPMPPGAALVYKVVLTFEPNHPLVSPSIQVGQGFEP